TSRTAARHGRASVSVVSPRRTARTSRLLSGSAPAEKLEGAAAAPGAAAETDGAIATAANSAPAANARRTARSAAAALRLPVRLLGQGQAGFRHGRIFRF